MLPFGRRVIVSTKHMTATIVERTDHTPELWSIRVQPEQELAFKPGQYVSFGLEVDGKILERAFSIVSSPAETLLEFFIESVPGGALSPRLHELPVGATLLMRKLPKGIFLLDRASGHPNHFLVCTVTGIAPYISMVRTTMRDWRAGGLPVPPRLVVLQGASRSGEFSYREELDAAARSAPWLSYTGTISRPWDDPGWTGERGRVDDVVRKYSDQLGLQPENTTGYLCGHPGMIANASGILQRRGFDKKAIREENYWPEAEAEFDY